MRHDVGTVAEIVVGDDPQAWRTIGFVVDDAGVCQVGATRVRLAGAAHERGRGILGWALAGVALPGGDDGLDGPDGLDGLPTIVAPAADHASRDHASDTAADTAAEATPRRESAGPSAATAEAADVAAPPTGDRDRAAAAASVHPNGVVAIDHVVAFTPDLDRTTAAIEAAGVAARRTREAARGRLQRFFRLGEVVLELVGPAEPTGEGPAAFWGLAFTVADIDATAAALGDRLGAPKTAVQPGRRIATLRKDDAVSVPVAFMSGDPARPPAAGSPAATAAGDDAGRSGDTSL